MHVGVEEAVAEDLGEENLHAVGRQTRQIKPQGLHLRDVVHGNEFHALHHHRLARGVVKIDFGDVEQGAVGEIATQGGGVGRLAHHVQFIVHGLVEFGDDFARTQAAAIGKIRFDQPGHGVEQCHIVRDGLVDAGAHEFHGDIAPGEFAGSQCGEMHLRHRRARHRRHVKSGKDAPPSAFARIGSRQQGLNFCGRKWRHAILQTGQLVGNVLRHQVRARGEQLAEFYEQRPQLLACGPQSCAARGFVMPPEEHRAQQQTRESRRQELVQAMANDDAEDAEKTNKAHEMK